MDSHARQSSRLLPRPWMKMFAGPSMRASTCTSASRSRRPYCSPRSRSRRAQLPSPRSRKNRTTWPLFYVCKNLNVHSCLIVNKCLDAEIDEEEATTRRTHENTPRGERAIATRIGAQRRGHSFAHCFYGVCGELLIFKQNQQFATNRLHIQKYTPSSTEGKLCALANWTDWMLDKGLSAQDFLPALANYKLAIKRRRSIR